MNLLSDPASIARHVVFIHGVRFAKTAVWLSSGRNPELWPRWLAQEIPGLGVWSIEHDSAPTQWRGHAMPLVDRANNVLALLLAEPRLAQGDIAFVVHSFGGLILQQALRVASDRSATEPHVADFVSHVSRVTFLGTPHRGVDLATWAGVLRLFIRPSSAAKGLARNDPSLRDLNQWFRRYAASEGIATQTLTESKRTYFFLVVPPDSADAGFPSDPIPVDSDHFGLASPSSRQSEIYVHIRNFLKDQFPPRGPKTLIDTETLQGIAKDTAANVKTLARIEDALSAKSIAASAAALVPQELVDAEAERRLTHLRKSRFLNGCEPKDQASRLADSLLNGDLQLASADRKARTLAWCARILMDGPDRELANECLRVASRLGRTPEVSVADAFGQSHDGDLAGALSTLSRLDSPLAKAAAFIIVRREKGPKEALAWLTEAGITLKDLDPDGKLFVMVAQLDARQFEGALASSSELGSDDFEQTPALLYTAADAQLASAVPVELVQSVRSQPAAALVPLSLADGVTAMERRRNAMNLYRRASRAASDLGCRVAALEASDRALLLAVFDPQARQVAITELQESLRSPDQSVRRLPIALEAGVRVDLDAADQELDRQTTLTAGGNEHTALARLAIARVKPTAERAAYLQTHRNELVTHLNPAFVTAIEISALVAADQLPRAEERLHEALRAGLPPEERDRLERLIADARESDPATARERRFLETDQLGDLMLLVWALEERHDWTRLAKYGAILFSRMRDLSSCTVYAQSLFRLGEFRRLVEFLREHNDLVIESDRLRAFVAWSLYDLGDLEACRTVLSALRASRDDRQDRHLVVNLAITSGDWTSLASFVEAEWDRKSDRTAGELLRAGQIAYQLRSTRANALIVEAAHKADDDPHVLLGCYSAAISAGWEDEHTYKWLERAAAQSDTDGPVQRVSLKELVDRQPAWQQRETRAWEQLNTGAIPMVAFGKMLNRSLIDVSLVPAIANQDTIDPRRRTLVYCYSGARPSSSVVAPTLAFDPIALLNAGMLGLLGKMLDTARHVLIPHSTLSWLFTEKQRIGSHQPSRVHDAQELRRLIDSDVLKRLEATVPIDEDLAREVGRDLASLFAEAEAEWGEDRSPRFVVRSGPVHRPGSLMEEEANLGVHANVVCGCLDVIVALVRLGRLTRVEEQRARTFLKLHEPARAPITVPTGAVLYLDGVSLAHLQHMRVLPKFEASGFTVLIPSDEVLEADRHIRYEALASRLSAVIEDIRDTLSTRIRTGQVVLAPAVRHDGDEDEDQDGPLAHPALDIFRICSLADAAVIDDRYFNKYPVVSHEGATRPIHTTFDLLSQLPLSRDEHAEYVARMRSAGIAFIPVTADELRILLERAEVSGDHLIETAELKALRENLLLCQMAGGLQLPQESVWFDGTIRVLLDAIKAQWRVGVDTALAGVRSAWLLEQLNLRGWSHRYSNEHNRGISEVRFRALLVALMSFNLGAPDELRTAYWKWLDEAVINSVRDQGAAYGALVDEVSGVIKQISTRQRGADDGD